MRESNAEFFARLKKQDEEKVARVQAFAQAHPGKTIVRFYRFGNVGERTFDTFAQAARFVHDREWAEEQSTRALIAEDGSELNGCTFQVCKFIEQAED